MNKRSFISRGVWLDSAAKDWFANSADSYRIHM